MLINASSVGPTLAVKLKTDISHAKRRNYIGLANRICALRVQRCDLKVVELWVRRAHREMDPATSIVKSAIGAGSRV